MFTHFAYVGLLRVNLFYLCYLLFPVYWFSFLGTGVVLALVKTLQSTEEVSFYNQIIGIWILIL